MEMEIIKKHIRDREYMGGIERDRARVKATGEVFTKEWLARQSLDKIEQLDPTAFSDPTKTFCDPACGDGNLIGEVLIRKLESLGKERIEDGEFEQALSTIYGIDFQEDNVKLCQDRLICGLANLRTIVERNIVWADSLRYHYRFDGSHPYDDEAKLLEQNNVFDKTGLGKNFGVKKQNKKKKKKSEPITSIFD